MPDQTEPTDRLDSWKEIAAHLRRRVRTVQRWERAEGLPVHRHRHERGSTVYAFTSELDAWRAQRRALLEEPGVADDSEDLVPPEAEGAAPIHPPHAERAVPPTLPRAFVLVLVIAAAALALAAVLAFVNLLVLSADRRAKDKDNGPNVLNSDAQDELVRGRYLVNRGTPESLTQGLAAFERAVKLDPNLALAHASLAEALCRSGLDGLARPADVYPKARAEAQTALRLDPDLAIARVTLARIAFEFDWDYVAAEAGFQEAIERAPSLAQAHHAYAQLLSAAGRHDESLRAISRAQELEPLSALILTDASWFYFRARRYREAIHESERVLALEPAQLGAHICILDANRMLGRRLEAKAALVRLLEATGNAMAAAEYRRLSEAEAFSRFERWRLESWERRRRAGHYAPPYPFVVGFAALGETDQAFEWLERALLERSFVITLLRVHPAFDGLRGDPRFDDLLRRAGVRQQPHPRP